MNVPANLVAPLFAFSVESGGQFEDLAPVILYGHKTAGGSMTDNVKTSCASRSQARALAGKGSMLEQMVTVFRKNAPTHPLYIVSIPASGTAEIRTITVGTVPAGGGTGVINIMGELVSISIAAGDSFLVCSAGSSPWRTMITLTATTHTIAALSLRFDMGDSFLDYDTGSDQPR